MELRVLRYFLAIAEQENISAAANFLHVSQPTLSRQLMDLEESLGVKLVERGNRRITLTDEGLLFRMRALEIISLIDKTEQEFKDAKEEIVGNIYLGAGETHVFHQVARIMKGIQKEHPKMQFHIYSGDAEFVVERLEKGLIDFGLLIEPVDTSKYQSIALSGHNTWGILTRRDSSIAQLQSITPATLQTIPLIVSRQLLEGTTEKNILDKAHDTYNIVATYNLIYNASVLVREGVGNALVLDQLIQEDEQLCFIPLRPNVELKLQMVWKKSAVLSKASMLFLTYLQEAYHKET